MNVDPSKNPRHNIVIIKPAGYLHSDALVDIAKLLHYSLQSLGLPSAITYNTFDASAVNIVLGYHLLGSVSQLGSYRTVLYQLEQLSDPEGWFATSPAEIRRAHV